MKAKIKVDPAKMTVPRLEPSYQKRVKVADSFDKYIMRMSERQERLYNWRKVHPPKEKKKKEFHPIIWTERRLAELIRLVNAGASNQEIADALFLSIHTVTTHRRNITAKLQIHSPAGLTIYAIINNLIDIAEVNLQ